MNFYVFDMNFNRLGIIKKYELSEITRNYNAHSELSFQVTSNADLIKLLFSDNGRIITKGTDITRGYLIEIPQFLDEDTQTITFNAKSLSVMTNWRTIPSQQVFSGNVEDVIKAFVNINCINPLNSNRIIPNLVLAENEGIDITVEEAYTEIELDVALWEMCNKHEMSYEILMDHTNKKYVFRTFKGVDRSDQQNINPRVIFAKKFGNVTRQSYVDDKSNMRTCAIVIGNYEDIYEPVVYCGDEQTGFNRREILVDARDIESIYTNADDVDISMTEGQYKAVLKEHGNSTLVEYKRVQTFESDIDYEANYEFGIDYELGDIIATRNDDLNIVMRSRVVQSVETYDEAGESLSLAFGEPILGFVDKVKRELKK